MTDLWARMGAWRARLVPLSLTSRLTLLLLAVGLTTLFVAQVLALRAYSQRIVSNHLDITEQMAAGKVEKLQSLLTSKSIALDELAQTLPAALRVSQPY